MTYYRDRLEAGEFAGGDKPAGLDSMTKAELIEEASRRGIEVSSAWSKEEIRRAVEGG